MKRGKRVLSMVGYAVCLVVCGGMILYPLLANMIYEQRQDTIITEYLEAVESAGDEEREKVRQTAEAYNEALLAGTSTEDAYEEQLNGMGVGLMGYLEIPTIQVELPVYHGVSEDVLEKGLGHVPQTTLPVGGAGMHAGITGHTGVSDRKLFSDLDQMEIGDWFYFHVLGETLAYEVEEILVVLPSETQYLEPIAGEDCITLITCTPFGINDHRLLVRGHRREYIAQETGTEEPPLPSATTVESTWLRKYMAAVGVGLVVFFAVLGGYAGWCWWRQNQRRLQVIRRGRKKRQEALKICKFGGSNG